MSQANTAMKATGGRAASRERRAGLVQGKTGLPRAAERSRGGNERAAVVSAPPVVVAPQAVQPAPMAKSEPMAAPSAQPTAHNTVLTGVQASRARRAVLVKGKAALKSTQQFMTSENHAPVALPQATASAPPQHGGGRQAAQALRGSRARNGGGAAQQHARPSGHVRKAEPIQYPPKVAESQSYGGKKVTGVRIGQGLNVTGDEPGAGVQVTGMQYVGKETGFNPRECGVKVGAARTPAGLTVTGTLVRSTVMVTGDESNPSLRITGEADQELTDDLTSRREQGAYTSMQFARQNNPHGHTVFGTNLGRSIKSAGSRERNREHAIEQTESGLPISGTAVGRSQRVTGDEAGACRAVSGNQYLMPGNKHAACDAGDGKTMARAGRAMGMPGHNEARLDPVTGEKVVVSETWSRQRITGLDVEHNSNVTGDESGACSPISGTHYAGPGQYEAFCKTGVAAEVAQRVLPGATRTNFVTGNTAMNVGHVTGTQRGAGRAVSGTTYYRADAEPKEQEMSGNAIERINGGFSVRSPQREAHLQADAAAVQAPSAASRITGTFAAGHGKITGNQEFLFSPRARGERSSEDKSRITGEGRAEGRAITGGAWDAHNSVTGTEGYIATERNPSERGGKPQAFANAAVFKGKGNHKAPTQHVTGMVGWSAKTAARVTLSGGAQG